MLDEMVRIRGGALLAIFLGLGFLYILLGIRDSVDDLRFIFKRRLLRRDRRFSLVHFLFAIALVACYFAVVQWIDAGIEGAVFCLGTVFCLVSTMALLRYAYQDITAKTVRRSPPEKFERCGQRDLNRESVAPLKIK